MAYLALIAKMFLFVLLLPLHIIGFFAWLVVPNFAMRLYAGSDYASWR